MSNKNNNYEHIGMRRKRERQEQKKRIKKYNNNGPLSLLITYIFDFVVHLFKTLINYCKTVNNSGYEYIYDIAYSDGYQIIPNDLKYGTMINLKSFRILINIICPPLGIFLSRGIYGWYHVLISFCLLYLNIIFGIFYSIIIMYIPSYGDRYTKYDYYRILTIRELLSNCSNIIHNDFKNMFPLYLFIGLGLIMTIIFYIILKYV